MSDNSTTSTNPCSIPTCGCGWTPSCGFCQPWHQNFLLIIILLIILVVLIGLLIYCCCCCCCWRWRKKISSKALGGKGLGLVHVSIINSGYGNGKRFADGTVSRSDFNQRNVVETNQNHEAITNSASATRSTLEFSKNKLSNNENQNKKQVQREYKEIVLEHVDVDDGTRPKSSSIRKVDPSKIREIENAVQEVEDLLDGLRWSRERQDGSSQYELVLEGLPLEDIPKNYIAVKEGKKEPL